ncbi:ATP-binding protein [Nonomuraea wenchangensis]
MIDLGPGGLIWRRTFPGAEDQVPEARHFARYLLADSSRRDDAELVVAELTTNAIRHTGSGRSRGTFIVELARTTVAVTVAVYDCGWGGVGPGGPAGPGAYLGVSAHRPGVAVRRGDVAGHRATDRAGRRAERAAAAAGLRRGDAGRADGLHQRFRMARSAVVADGAAHRRDQERYGRPDRGHLRPGRPVRRWQGPRRLQLPQRQGRRLLPGRHGQRAGVRLRGLDPLLQAVGHQGRRTGHGRRLPGRGAQLRVPGRPALAEPDRIRRARPVT